MKNSLPPSPTVHYMIESIFIFNSLWSRHVGNVAISSINDRQLHSSFYSLYYAATDLAPLCTLPNQLFGHPISCGLPKFPQDAHFPIPFIKQWKRICHRSSDSIAPYFSWGTTLRHYDSI